MLLNDKISLEAMLDKKASDMRVSALHNLLKLKEMNQMVLIPVKSHEVYENGKQKTYNYRSVFL